VEVLSGIIDWIGLKNTSAMTKVEEMITKHNVPIPDFFAFHTEYKKFLKSRDVEIRRKLPAIYDDLFAKLIVMRGFSPPPSTNC
jgi:hypothetical protein